MRATEALDYSNGRCRLDQLTHYSPELDRPVDDGQMWLFDVSDEKGCTVSKQAGIVR
jgi:hypothetical protein